MGSGYKWHQCNVLFSDGELENMGIEENMWLESYVNLEMVVGFSDWENNDDHGTQLMLQGSLGVVIDTPFEKFKEILTE